MDRLHRYSGMMILGLLLGTGACSKDDDDGSGATGEDGTSGDDGTGDGTGGDDGTGSDDGTSGTDGTGGDDGTSSDDGTDGDVCEEYGKAPDDFGPAVTVTIRNSRADPIYVKTTPYDGEPPFALSDASGDLFWAPDYSCQIVSCGQMMTGLCEVACPGCMCGEAILIKPGATYEAIWPGALYEEADLPAECNAEGCEITECAKPSQAPDGAYTVTSVAHTELACQEPPCECEPSEDWCIIETGDPSEFQGDELQASADVDYPTATAAEIDFE